MQPRLGHFLIVALHNMRALLLLLLTCCIYFAYVDGLKSSSKVMGPGLSKYQTSDILNVNDGSSSASILDIRGGSTISEASKASTGVPLFVVKIFLQLALTSVNMLSWAIPLRSKNLTNNSKLLGLANAFAGGIFLMLAFGHMLPHSVSVFESIGTDKNIAFKFTLVGYLLVFFIEKIAFDSHALMHEATDDIETHSLSHGHGLGHGQGHIGGQTNAIKYTNEQSERAYTSVQHDPSTPHPVLGGLGGLGGVPLGVNKGTGTGTGTVEQSVAATVIDADDVEKKGSLSPKSAIVLLMAMSVHSLFETMALGLANDKMSAILMAASIGLHQPAESIALLVAFLKTSMPKRSIMKWLMLFSAIGPLGVTTGVLISKIATPLMDGIIVAITAGTFLYVGATEVVGEEFENVQGWEKWRKFGAFLGGMAMILVVTSATESWENSVGMSHDQPSSLSPLPNILSSSHSHPDL